MQENIVAAVSIEWVSKIMLDEYLIADTTYHKKSYKL